jgi:homopolymeric O-antigen transport system ATP-binding protein
MTEPVIRVHDLAKRYRLGERVPYKSLRESLSNGLRRVMRRARPRQAEWVWALQNLAFDVVRGEVVGIIGRNGAGKTTLLKILSRITEPTEGRVELRGRVGCLLEVGTGFHPELTGRENVFLSGAVLGMTKAEIRQRFDEIVSFAEVEDFLDTPVKRYSSGMYLRLAFSVAAHLDTDILLVDEILAVGDAAFQKKCLGKMDAVSRGGRTILFVSHDMGAVASLTKRTLYLENGTIAVDGPSQVVIGRYLADSLGNGGPAEKPISYYRREENRDTPVRVSSIRAGSQGEGAPTVFAGDQLVMYIGLEVFGRLSGANVTLGIKNIQGQRVTTIFSPDHGFTLNLSPGRHQLRISIEDLALAPGEYFVDVGVNQSTRTKAFDVILDYPLVRVVADQRLVHWLNRPWGVVCVLSARWEVSP